MDKRRIRRYLDDGLIVLVIMAGAVVAAALEAGAVIGGVPGSSMSAFAMAGAGKAEPARAAASSPVPEPVLALGSFGPAH